MSINSEIRDFLDTSDSRVTGQIGADHLFHDRCDHHDCASTATILTETVIQARRGALREGGIYCATHGFEAVNALTFEDADEINVTVPASLLAGYGTLAA